MSIQACKILPKRITDKLLTLAIKAAMAASESSRGRQSASYLRVIQEIDQVTADTKAQFPHFYRA